MENNLRHTLISYLNANGLEPLADKDIRVGKDSRYPNLYNLKYGSILADKSDPIVCACRGAVVEQIGDRFELVGYAFDRFFNLGEGQAADIDWSTASVYEKYDGSLIKLFFWKGMWVVSTSGSVGGAGSVGQSSKTFEELFWETFDYLEYQKSNLDTDNCYIFELCCLDNRIVVKYEQPELRLLAVRNRRDDFAELPLCDFESVFDVASSYPLGADQLLQAVNERGADFEGFIVCDANGNRIKVKSDVYVQLHRVRGNGEPDFSELYLNDDLDEFLLHFPEYGERFNGLRREIDAMGVWIDEFVKEHSALNQKDFAALAINDHKNVSGAMFGIRSGKYANFKHFVEELTPKRLDNLLGLGN